MSIASKLSPSFTKPQIHWQGQGPALVLIHGWGMNGAVWQDLAEALVNKGWRVGSLDLPGFGHSQALPAGATLVDFAEAVAAALPQGRCHLLGWSLGGLVAQQLALTWPERVASLVTLASSPCFTAQQDWAGIQPAVLQQFAEQLEQDLGKTLNGFFALQAMGSPSAREDVRRLKRAVMSQPQAQPQALADGLAMLAQVDLRSELDKIRCPWLRLYGRMDGLVPYRSLAPMARLASASQVQVLAKAAHAPFVSHPDATLQALSEFYLAQGAIH
ncbi:pimeloyl-ACP methyl ester esterase BioH [Ferrimonas marina]|uniref:Pimeloyl-[acyl-carrier protein] methyl ester esterase n=1 Tax=Ferrimonas marina TaxID=299255 RepID=A0A1M5Z990_9GAMM|nr:pimeloyl-ACP methyl ester esterase BioH [Ferrimonas marina]SHI20787.1 pimeloyl-[acyl-carrier protein] methyl ester esterase [Ferrimonas marina]